MNNNRLYEYTKEDLEKYAGEFVLQTFVINTKIENSLLMSLEKKDYKAIGILYVILKDFHKLMQDNKLLYMFLDDEGKELLLERRALFNELDKKLSGKEE